MPIDASGEHNGQRQATYEKQSTTVQAQLLENDTKLQYGEKCGTK